MKYAIYGNVMEPGKLYYSGGLLVNVEETNDGFILSSSGSNGDEKEYGYFRFVYDGNKLARAEASNIMYTYLEDWELWGACVFDKQVYDFKTNMAYTIQIEGKIPEKEVEEDPGEVGGDCRHSRLERRDARDQPAPLRGPGTRDGFPQTGLHRP